MMYFKGMKKGEKPLRAYRGMLRELERNVNLNIAMVKLQVFLKMHRCATHWN